MEVSKNNIIVYILLSGIIISSVLGCVFFAQSMMMTDRHGSSIAKCCERGVLADMASHNPPSMLVSILLLLGLASTWLFINFGLVDNDVLSYCQSSKQSGGYNTFNNFILIFSQGIIHPKIY